MSKMTKTHTLVAVLALAIGCKAKSDSAAAPRDQPTVETTRADKWADTKAPAAAPADPNAMALDEGKMGNKDAEDRGEGQYKQRAAGGAAHAPVPTPKIEDKKKGKNEGEDGAEGPTRSWFPETFLFDPLVVTDDSGTATVPVRVPDRLTTWRVLALAHSRTGEQAGATTSFLGTLPTYVDPIVPKRLVIGDKIRLPIQVVNTTGEAVQSKLSLAATNATLTGNPAAQTVPAQSSVVDYVELAADHAGVASVRVGLGSTDAVLRTIAVAPAGKPMTITRSGTLAAPRTLDIDGIANADAATDHVRLLAYPGALALLRKELAVSTDRAGVADDAYALLLAGRASALLQSLGDKADPEVIRNLSIVTAQRALRDARSLDVTSATLLADAALAHPNNPVLVRLGERAAEYLAKNQRPDGTFAGATGWTLQRVLVASAEATRAVAAAKDNAADRQRAMGVAAKAGGAFERNIEHVDDGFTAAAILASGAVSSDTAVRLKKVIKDHVKDASDGAKYIDVGDGVVRADGRIPSRALATALAVLALQGDKDAPVADLGATLLGSYDPDHGWGDGVDNLACMQAILMLFKDPMPANVKITLMMDGKPVVEGQLSAEAIRDVLVLDAPVPGLASKHEWKVVAEPAVPGLGYALSLQGYVPWDKETTNGGLELALPTTVTGTVGKPTEIAVNAIAPSGMPLHVVQALPAGVQLDRPSVQALVDAGTIARFETADGKLELWINPLSPGQTFAAKYRVIPTLAGTIHAPASMIEAGETVFHVPPSTWTIN